MGLKLPRRKKKNRILALAYRVCSALPIGGTRKLKLLLDMAWIFSRLAHEQTFRTSITLPGESRENRFLLSFIPENASVLDIGCGKGHIAKQILAKTSHITGIDYDRQSIESAKENLCGTGVTLINDDIFNLLPAFEEKAFDYVILSHVLEHIDEPVPFLKAMSRIGKYFYVEVPDFEATHLNLFRKEIGTDLVYSDADHVYEFDRADLSNVITESGLRITRSEFRGGVIRYWCENKI